MFRQCRILRGRFLKGHVLLALAAFTSLVMAGSALADPSHTNREAGTLNSVAVYHPDPEHLWNRLYAAFYIRAVDESRTTGHDELDAPLWPFSKHLLEGASHRRAMAVLDEFLSEDGETQIQDRLKRAMLQRDMWAIFDHLAQPGASEWRDENHLTAQQDALAVRLAGVIRRLALPREEINQLPDNYALAVKAAAYPPQHDPADAKGAFLPPDLLKSEGPWVAYGDSRKVVAPQHTQAYFGRAAFYVLMRLPDGRSATLEYVKDARPPQFPPGTQVALVKQAMLIDDHQRITPTRITEQLQIRVYRHLHLFDAYEFHLERKAVFEGNNGGLRAISDGERHFSAFAQLRTQTDFDPWEHPSRASLPIPLPQPESGNANLATSCVSCHPTARRPGIHSFLTSGEPMDRETLADGTIGWKERHATWGRLQSLLMVDR